MVVYAWLGVCLWAGVAVPLQVAAQPSPETWQAAINAHLAKNYLESITLLNQYIQESSTSSQLSSAQYFLAENYYLSGQIEKAKQLFRELAKNSSAVVPLRISARYREAEIAFNQEDYLQAADILNGLYRESQADFLFPQVPLALVKVDLKLKRNDDAQRVFKRVLETYPRALLDPEIKFLYGIMKEYQGKPMDALKIYEEFGDDGLACLFSGAILESQGQYLPAIEAYNQASRLAPLSSHKQEAEYFKMRAFYKSGDFLAAKTVNQQFWEKYPASVYRPQAALLRLMLWQAQGNFNEVLSGYAPILGELAKLEPEDQALFNLTLGEANLNLNHYPEAVLYFTQALGSAGKYRGDILLKLAYAHMALQDWNNAWQRITEYLRSTKSPEPLGQLLAVRINLETGHESGAFQAAQALAKSGDAMMELGFQWLAGFNCSRHQPQKLVSQWPLLEKNMADHPVKAEYREAAAQTRLLVADAYFQEGDYNRARVYYQKALDIYPREPVKTPVYAGLVWTSFKLLDYAATIQLADKCYALPDLNENIAVEISLVQAHAYFNLKDYDQAIRAYEKWLAASPRHAAAASVKFQIGWAHYLNKSYLDAVDTWRALADEYPQAPESQDALFWVADIYFQAGENAKAREIYQRLISQHPEAASRKSYELRVAQAYYNEGQDDEAVKRFTVILQAYPNSDEAKQAQQGIETASYRITDRMNSIQAFRDYITKFPGSNLAEDIQYRIGEAYFAKEQYAESLTEFLKFVITFTKSPRTPNAQYYISVCQEQLGNLAEAIPQAEAFMKNYPQHELAPEMTFRLATMEFQQEKYSQAAEHYLACAENYNLKEYQPKAWFNAAVAYEKLHLAEQAAVNYEKVTRFYPDDPNAKTCWARLASLYAEQANVDGSLAALEQLRNLGDAEQLQKTYFSVATFFKEQNNLTEEINVLKKLMQYGQPKSKDYSVALVELASLYEQLKEWKEAKAVYQRLAVTTSESKWRLAATKRIELLTRIIKSQ